MQKPTETDHPDHGHSPSAESVLKALQKRSFATLATTSPAGNPHVAGVIYELVDDSLYVNTLRSSRKARNVEANGKVAICVMTPRIPFGPPSTVHFQANAELLPVQDRRITGLVRSGSLKALTGHGELDLPDGCFLRIQLPPRLLTYGLGMSLRRFIADPLNAGGAVQLETSRP